ncbi:hypothetical protein [Goodfellowiella coeruleoviolacea]|uniref:hypothetical protein n=1 Tax=Goodfellowiella coeruleoviolacea TaxID=334858 RepID=UPI0020A2FA93|nr:hypothetical protein [Goodfellowiella coeruleoviolacea]
MQQNEYAQRVADVALSGLRESFDLLKLGKMVSHVLSEDENGWWLTVTFESSRHQGELVKYRGSLCGVDHPQMEANTKGVVYASSLIERLRTGRLTPNSK